MFHSFYIRIRENGFFGGRKTGDIWNAKKNLQLLNFRALTSGEENAMIEGVMRKAVTSLAWYLFNKRVVSSWSEAMFQSWHIVKAASGMV